MVNRPHDDGAIALEAIEQVRLPQWPVAIQRFAENRHDRLDELRFGSIRGQLMELDVILQREVGVVLKRRVIQIERHRDKALTVARNQRQLALEMPHQLRIRDLVLEERERADMQRPVARLAVNESGVLTSEPRAQLFNCDRLFSHCSHASETLAKLLAQSSRCAGAPEPVRNASSVWIVPSIQSEATSLNADIFTTLPRFCFERSRAHRELVNAGFPR